MFLVDYSDRISWLRIALGSLATGLLVAGGIWFLDYPLLTGLRWLDGWFWQGLTMFGAPKFWLVASLLVFLYKVWTTGVFGKKAGDFIRFVISGKQPLLTASAVVFSSVLTASVISEIIKFIVGRLRPVFYESMGKTGFFNFSVDDMLASLPSGHAAASFAALVAIGLMFPRAKRYVWAAAIVLALSRVIVGAHFPSDVILGAFIGMFIADMTYMAFKRASGN